jgi:hypothetical protein
MSPITQIIDEKCVDDDKQNHWKNHGGHHLADGAKGDGQLSSNRHNALHFCRVHALNDASRLRTILLSLTELLYWVSGGLSSFGIWTL